jgi:BirA family transcriptional regulator, biotin operon repressor / biotin---[acetyl-CoA-carboxylase] ligase
MARGMAAGSGWRLEIHPELPSTSNHLIALARDGAPDGLAVLALRQTAGRGRDGRTWSDAPGNLALSVLIRPRHPAREAPQWSLLGGVALAEAARAIDPEPDALRLRWPNDLLRRGAKCAGLLAESALSPDGGLAWLVLGFGVNLAHAPAVPGRATARLGRPEPPEAFAARLLDRVGAWRRVRDSEGFGPIRDAWAALGPVRGERIAARWGQGTAEGGFAGLSGDGSLLLQTGQGVLRIAAGEVMDPAPDHHRAAEAR